MMKKKPLSALKPTPSRRQRLVLYFLALLIIGFGWQDDIVAFVRARTDNRAIPVAALQTRLGDLVHIQSLTHIPFDIFCLIAPRQTAVGEQAGLAETAINETLKDLYPEGLPDDTWAFVYADNGKVRVDTYRQELGRYHFLNPADIHKNTLSSFMDHVHPASCANSAQAGFFPFPSGGVILARFD